MKDSNCCAGFALTITEIDQRRGHLKSLNSLWEDSSIKTREFITIFDELPK